MAKENVENFIKSFLKCWKIHLNKKYNLSELNDDNDVVNSLYFDRFFDYLPVSLKNSLNFLEETRPEDKDFIEFLNDYENSFLIREYGRKGVQYFESDIFQALHEDFYILDISSFGNNIKRIEHRWASDKIYKLTDENGKEKFFIIPPNYPEDVFSVDEL